MLLLLFAVFLYYTLGEALQRRDDPLTEEAAVPGLGGRAGEPTGLRIALLILGGLGALVAGGELTVGGATGIAAGLGLSETVIGLTVVAVGTSLPELATTLSAARKGQGDLAVGNIVGSNIYNLLFVWGLSVTIEPSAMPAGGVIDLLVVTALSLALLPMAITHARLGRLEGALMLAAYAGYIGWLIVRSVG